MIGLDDSLREVDVLQVVMTVPEHSPIEADLYLQAREKALEVAQRQNYRVVAGGLLYKSDVIELQQGMAALPKGRVALYYGFLVVSTMLGRRV